MVGVDVDEQVPAMWLGPEMSVRELSGIASVT